MSGAGDAVGHGSAAAAAMDPWQRYSWLFALIWLPFLFYPVSDLVGATTAGAASAVLVAGWSGVAAFPALFLAGFVIGTRSGWGSSTGMVRGLFAGLVAAVALTIPAIGGGALSFLPFVMPYATFALRGLWHPTVTMVAVALAVGGLGVPGTTSYTSPAFAGIVVLVALLNSLQSWLIGRSMGREQLRLELAASRERESLARDVHDLVGHTLTVVTLKAELTAITDLAAETIAGVRGVVTGLRATDFADQLAASRAALETAGVTAHVRGEVASLSPAQAITASWILREATTNIIRHARARAVAIEVRPGTMVVSDDGTGLRGTAGNGVRGMSERAAASGAELSIDDRPEGGTSVRVQW